jgi:hypothetical protein
LVVEGDFLERFRSLVMLNIMTNQTDNTRNSSIEKLESWHNVDWKKVNLA